jgi:5-methyltetrahydrofolate--homocysteine methyltransferase
METNNNFSLLANAIIDGKYLDAGNLTSVLLEGGASPGEILENGLLRGMEVVGKRFKENVIFLPQVLISARAMKEAMKILEPLMIGTGRKPRGKVLIGTVKGDLHDIGKNLVSIMLQGNGYSVIDLGTDCSTEKFLTGVETYLPDVIGLSALLTTTMVYMKTVIDFLRQHGIFVPVIIGGAPINQKFADEIGADGYGRNASEAVELVTRILSNGGTERDNPLDA